MLKNSVFRIHTVRGYFREKQLINASRLLNKDKFKQAIHPLFCFIIPLFLYNSIFFSIKEGSGVLRFQVFEKF